MIGKPSEFRSGLRVSAIASLRLNFSSMISLASLCNVRICQGFKLPHVRQPIGSQQPASAIFPHLVLCCRPRLAAQAPRRYHRTFALASLPCLQLLGKLGQLRKRRLTRPLHFESLTVPPDCGEQTTLDPAQLTAPSPRWSNTSLAQVVRAPPEVRSALPAEGQASV
eukprot:4516730-Karenia_brevis.AAC.1